jgi:iron complex outermembrane recepter protein
MLKRTLSILAQAIVVVFFAQAEPESPQRPSTDANIFGHVLDAETGDHLPFVNLLIKGTRIGTMTDATGHYLLTNLPVGRHTLIVQSMGFETTEVVFEIREKQTLEVDVEVRRRAIDLAEIVLTASPTASGFRYQPDAVFLGDKLQRYSEASFGEMLNGQPGVAMRSLGSAPARPVIRGLDGDRILVLENGERMGDIAETSADHSISLDPLAASRIEVVRGPASLLYGSSALGGVINLMTTDIPEDWDQGLGGVLSAQGATMNSMGAGFARATFGKEKWAGTARLSYRQAGNITTPEGEIPGTSMRNYDGSLGWGLNRENLKGGLSFSMTNQTFEIPEFVDEPDERVEIRAQRQALQGRFQKKYSGFFDQAQLRFNTSRFIQHEVEVEKQDDGSEIENIELEYEQLALSSTLTLQHKPIGLFDRGAFGMSFQGRVLDIYGDDAYTPGEQRFTLGLFTFQEMPLSNTTRLQFGVRLDFQNMAARSTESFPDIDMTRNAANYSGSFGLNYRPVKGVEIGGQFARSHRNPSAEELFARGVHLGAGVYEIGNENLKDEIGHGGDLFANFENGRFSIEVAGYVNYFRNFIVFQPTGLVDEGSGYPIFEYQGDEARLMGSEIQAAYQITGNLTLNSGIDYVRGQRINGENGGENLPFIPPFRFSAEMEYNFRSAWLSARVQSVARQGKVAPGEETTDGYTLLGFVAGYRLDFHGRHVIIFRADNMLDTKYRDHLSRMEDRNLLMPGRNFTLAYRWFF